jgi:hypothetical protein
MFREANTDETKWVRAPIISYLQACPLPIAQDHIEELREIDPDAVKRAEMLADLDWDDEETDDWEEEEESNDAADEDLEKAFAEEANSSTEDNTGAAADNTGDDDGNSESSDDDGGEANSPADGGSDDSGDGGSPVSTWANGSDEIVAGDHVRVAVETATSGEAARFVSTRTPPDVSNSPEREQLADAATATPLATVGPALPSNMMILGVAFVVCVLLFALCWSVLNGWFEKLLF